MQPYNDDDRDYVEWPSSIGMHCDDIIKLLYPYNVNIYYCVYKTEKVISQREITFDGSNERRFNFILPWQMFFFGCQVSMPSSFKLIGICHSNICIGFKYIEENDKITSKYLS